MHIASKRKNPQKSVVKISIHQVIYSLNILPCARSLSKVEFAKALGKRPSEVTKWPSGQHNFTLRTISLLPAFFGEELIAVKAN